MIRRKQKKTPRKTWAISNLSSLDYGEQECMASELYYKKRPLEPLRGEHILEKQKFS